MDRPPRRSVLGSIAAGSLAATAGCLDDVLATDPDRSSQEYDTHLALDEDSLSEGEFTDRIEQTTATYGSEGFWGRTETEPSHDLEFRRGWRMEPVDSDNIDDDHLLALYAFPDEDFLGDPLFSLWFWSGVETTTEDTPIERLTTGVDLESDSARMVDFSPKGLYETADGDEAILVGFDTRESIPNIDGAPQIERPTVWSDVAYDTDASTMGWGGSFAVDYTGEATSTRAMTAACLVAAENESAIDATWHATVELDS